MLVLKSVDSDTEIAFHSVQCDSFWVAVRASDHSGTVEVYDHVDPTGVVSLFAEAAKEWQGWDGEKRWESLEGQFQITLISDSLGHISVKVHLWSKFGGSDLWDLRAEITLEAGQLEEIAKKLERYWAEAN